jgi:hypothetical protein
LFKWFLSVKPFNSIFFNLYRFFNTFPPHFGSYFLLFLHFFFLNILLIFWEFFPISEIAFFLNVISDILLKIIFVTFFFAYNVGFLIFQILSQIVV